MIDLEHMSRFLDTVRCDRVPVAIRLHPVDMRTLQASLPTHQITTLFEHHTRGPELVEDAKVERCTAKVDWSDGSTSAISLEAQTHAE